MWIKHGKSQAGVVSAAGLRNVEVKPERSGITVVAAGEGVLAVKVNFTNLPAPERNAAGQLVGWGKRPSRMRAWFTRPSQGEIENGTGQMDYAVPFDDNPEFKIVHTYLTQIEKAGDVVHFYIWHNGRTTLKANLAQTIVLLTPTTATATPTPSSAGIASDPPPAMSFRVGTNDPRFTAMGQRFIVWLGPDIVHDGNGYTPGPVFSAEDTANIRKVQVLMGDPPDPVATASLGPVQWRRLFTEVPPGSRAHDDPFSEDSGGSPDSADSADSADSTDVLTADHGDA